MVAAVVAGYRFSEVTIMSTLPFQGRVIFRTFVPDSGFGTYAMLTAGPWSFYPKTVEITCAK